ncbi:tRNA (adenosine(37)-N6)-threonylcarbamoyltransferase complex ATPase subunit type 1 TsaE [Sphingobacterium sp. SGG-5]|uniref:tRNA (adenosine(37)-N6)-threonylcarbamoyltransferase complex ATPase subunit type 1 TsaE n=1 Tax=Sphingobacterium sp. SGG-5 TaxID=2710881 RepID=UPI0013EB7E18|nr:tRNA (adenosine(37)-N6)-threonylcarbamoyltransferase complex ATPase subunit type 1 TsaE [Sphingobacterium sp. SGG-5]NGM62358.1 tRNA (adenosine(37)-N6)-threonylcarbamoyltransferase complex ATPase subunit type 1 TsaE [Sphingobacterium sp. SGG-5]
MTLVAKSLSDLPDVAQEIISTFPEERIFLFYGNMGAGKTTLIHALCVTLGVQEQTSSPTFSIVNEYSAEKGTLYHFDFYRLKNESEAYDLGYEEYFYSGNYCFVEWPEKIANLLPEQYLKIAVEATENQQRTITIETKK